MNRIILVILALATFAFSLFSQRSASGQENTSEKKSYKPGDAWTLSWPLGTHETSTIDTLLYGLHREFIPSMCSDAWATTGSFSAEGINMIYFDRAPRSQFIFEDAINHWIPTFSKEKFYNVYIPMTLLTYDFGGNRNNHNDRLKGVFAGNVNRKIGVGANIDYLYSKGSYSYQAAKNLIYGLQGYYNGDRYEMQAFFNHYHSMNQENGGITNDLYITDPAELQGGVEEIEAKSIPTNLTRAKNRVIGAEFYMNHAYKLGFWRDITTPQDTVDREIFVPVTKFLYSFDYRYGHHIFTNQNSSEGSKFWENTYFNSSQTNDQTHYYSFTNILGVEMIEGFQKWAKFGLSAYAEYQIDRFRVETAVPSSSEGSSLTPDIPGVPEELGNKLEATRHRIWIGGRLEKTKGSLLRYAANAKFGLSGDAVGELAVDGNVQTNFRLAKDTVVIAAEGFFRNTSPSWMLQHYVSNHFRWDNDFGKTRSFRVGGRLHIPWTRTDLRAGVENIQNYIYFNSSSLPQQYGGSVQIFSASLDQKLNYKILHWDNNLTYQVTSNKDIIPLPSLAWYSNLYLDFEAFKVLRMQIGLDWDYYTKYRGLDYQPATMQFHVQGENPVDVGNFVLANLYVNAKIKKTRFFIVWSHFNQGLLGKSFFSLPHYPIDPRQLKFGLSIDFAN
ncbi:MAG: putative porin [Muribaculaceae bacterium]|nr:putative porin [Muribaculaceae bacterium]